MTDFVDVRSGGTQIVFWDVLVSGGPYSTQWGGVFDIWDGGVSTWDSGATQWGDPLTFWAG